MLVRFHHVHVMVAAGDVGSYKQYIFICQYYSVLLIGRDVTHNKRRITCDDDRGEGLESRQLATRRKYFSLCTMYKIINHHSTSCVCTKNNSITFCL